jgi:hypothetical protein
MGSATANKRGIDLATITGSAEFDFCSFHDFSVASSRGINVLGTSWNNIAVRNCVGYNIHSEHFNTVSATSGTNWIVDSCVWMLSVSASANLANIVDMGGTYTNDTHVGSAAAGCNLSETLVAGDLSAKFTGLVSHSNAGAGFQGVLTAILGTFSAWRNGGVGCSLGGGVDMTMTVTAFGNVTSNITMTSGTLRLPNLALNGDTTFSTANGIQVTPTGRLTELFIHSGSLGVASGILTTHTTGDITIAATTGVRATLQNTILGSATEISGQTNLLPSSVIGSSKHDQTAGSHKSWKMFGTLSSDTTAGLFRTASPSLRMTPNTAAFKLDSQGLRGGFVVPVANGATLTPSVYVRESVVGDGQAYNGARIRLLVKRNDAIGITADTVLATATVTSVGAFELLSGTTIAATDDGTMEFVIDVDGTAGWANVDDFTAGSQANALLAWLDGAPSPSGLGSGGAGGGGAVFGALGGVIH